MAQISKFLTTHWKVLGVFVFVLNFYNSTENKLTNLAIAQTETSGRVDNVQKLQIQQTALMADKISTIEILVNRIDERTSNEARIRRQKDIEEDQQKTERR